VGPAVEVSLPFGLALEFDALYKRLDYNFSSKMRAASFGTFNQQQHNIVSRWDLPLLLKYRVRTFAYRTPYISAGLNTNYIVNTTQLSRTFFTPSSGAPAAQTPPAKLRNPPAELKYKSAEGFVIAGGLEFRIHGLRAAPELRYTRWAHENFHELLPAGKLRSYLNQAEVLVALSF